MGLLLARIVAGLQLAVDVLALLQSTELQTSQGGRKRTMIAAIGPGSVRMPFLAPLSPRTGRSHAPAQVIARG